METTSRPILNPFVAEGSNNCFGCDPNNQIGLKLQFVLKEDEVTNTWEPRPDLEGYRGIVHGGIQATLADETAAWYIYAVYATAGVTQSLEIRYRRPAFTADGPFTVRARGQRDEDGHARIHVTILSASGKVCAESECVYLLFSEAVARRRFAFPGGEAFFDSN